MDTEFTLTVDVEYSESGLYSNNGQGVYYNSG